MNKKLISVLALSALALTSCSTGVDDQEARITAVVTHTAESVESPLPTPTPTPLVDPNQAWADDMINLLLNGNSKSSFEDFNPEIAHHYIESWSQPKPGVLAIKVQDKNWTKCDLDSLGMNVLDTAGWDNPKLRLVEVSAGDSKPRVTDRNNEYGVPSSCA